MLSILLAGGVALTVTLLGTPLFIRFLVAKQYGQFIRQDGPTSHQIKRGTPTMGGVMIILGTVLGYAFGNGVTGRPPDVSGLLLLFLMVGLGFIGFLDDSAKIRHRQSLGLTPWMKIVGQGLIGITFAVLALRFRNNQNRAPASTRISVLRDSGLDLAFAGTALGLVLFIAWANFLITAWSNAVNLTDGLDGLATGASMFAFGAYTVITMWQSNQSCVGVLSAAPGCYNVRDPRDLAIACAALVGVGACRGTADGVGGCAPSRRRGTGARGRCCRKDRGRAARGDGYGAGAGSARGDGAWSAHGEQQRVRACRPVQDALCPRRLSRCGSSAHLGSAVYGAARRTAHRGHALERERPQA